jgi:hypothetical protein
MGPKPSILVVASDQMVPAQCEVVAMAHWRVPQSGKWPGSTKSGGPSIQRTLHNQDSGPRPVGHTMMSQSLW